jgi:formylglycine-generating enzyme required for sulfatase activity
MMRVKARWFSSLLVTMLGGVPTGGCAMGVAAGDIPAADDSGGSGGTTAQNQAGQGGEAPSTGGAGGAGAGAGAAGGGAAAGGTGGTGTGGFGGGSSGTPPPMVAVPAGSFTMGCPSSCEPDNTPTHAVTLSAFEITETEITQQQYGECVQAAVCSVPSAGYDPVGKPLYPVDHVSWQQAAAYCAWVGARLPTEAEWEKTARGADARSYPWGNAAPSCALSNFHTCHGGTEPVGTHPSGASPYGALDMAGNVWEWVQDYYGHDYYANSPGVDPQGPASGTERVIRGGGYDSPQLDLIDYERDSAAPSAQAAQLGFRCVSP